MNSSTAHVIITTYNETSTRAGNLTSMMTSASRHTADSDENVSGKVIAVLISLVAIAVLAVLGYCYLKRSGKLARLSCRKYTRARRSSTSSSRRALEDNDVMDPPIRSKQAGDTDDMFTIEEYEDAQEVVGNKEEYFYDEVFGQSQFEDEATNTAMRELYSTRQSDGEQEHDEEMLDLDFETLGIRIDRIDSKKYICTEYTDYVAEYKTDVSDRYAQNTLTMFAEYKTDVSDRYVQNTLTMLQNTRLMYQTDMYRMWNRSVIHI
ncbi:hypothetical protein Btru_049824 [Bulinus truncatus]|nr:hypothetical protein Btru_049824 [Bulinus truncatus]